MRRSRIFTVLAVRGGLIGVLLAIGLTAVSSSTARVRVRPTPASRSTVLHLRWRLLATGATPTVVDQRYIVLQPHSGLGAPTLLDNRTGRRTQLLPPGCDSSSVGFTLFGGPYLAAHCNSPLPVHLFDRGQGTWSTVAPAPSLAGFCSGGCAFAGIGARWIAFGHESPPGCNEYCGYDAVEQNLQTGEVQAEQPERLSGRSYPDLNAPNGVATLCSPLRFPPSYNPGSNGDDPGSLTLFGQYAVTEQFLRPDGNRIAHYLERCHSRLHLLLVTYDTWASQGGWGTDFGVAASNEAVVWPTSRGGISGVRLPGLQRFTAQPPALSTRQAVYFQRLDLSGLTLLVTTSAGEVWESKLPTVRR